MAETIRESTKQVYLGRIDALLERKSEIAALSTEDLAKIANFLGRAADNEGYSDRPVKVQADDC